MVKRVAVAMVAEEVAEPVLVLLIFLIQYKVGLEELAQAVVAVELISLVLLLQREVIL